MSTVADKLSYLVDTKTAIKNAIIAKGVDVDNSVTFRQYADKIGEIEGDSGVPEYMMYAIVDEGATSIPAMSSSIVWFMSKVYVPPSVINVGDYFVAKSGITEFLGGVNILTFGSNAFNGCALVTTIDLPSVIQLGNSAFFNCVSLVNISLPSVTWFGSNAFLSSQSLTNINLGNRLNVLTISTSFLQSDNLTVDSFLQVGNALVDNTGGSTKTIYVKSVAWNRLSTAQKAIFTNKNYTISVS